MTSYETQLLHLGTKLLQATLVLFTQLAKMGGKFILEHPRDRGHSPFPSIWNLPEVKQLQEDSGAQEIHLDQCMFQQTAKKPTTLLTNTEGGRKLLERKCCHRCHQEVFLGSNPDRTFRMARAQTYPEPLCPAMADALFQDLCRM